MSILVFTKPNFTFSQNADIDLLKRINVDRNKSFDPTMKLVSSSVTPISIAVPLTELSVGLIRNDNKLKTDALVDAVSLLGAYAVTYSMKYIVNRERPYETYDFIENLANDDDPSFPSGHATNSFSTATSFSLAYKKWYAVLPAYTWAIAVGYSRMHMGMHYPGDVVAGAVIGSGAAVLVHQGRKWISKRSKNDGSFPQQ